jgi:hypothetical protein
LTCLPERFLLRFGKTTAGRKSSTRTSSSRIGGRWRGETSDRAPAFLEISSSHLRQSLFLLQSYSYSSSSSVFDGPSQSSLHISQNLGRSPHPISLLFKSNFSFRVAGPPRSLPPASHIVPHGYRSIKSACQARRRPHIHDAWCDRRRSLSRKPSSLSGLWFIRFYWTYAPGRTLTCPRRRACGGAFRVAGTHLGVFL